MAVTRSQKINLGIFVVFSLGLLIAGIIFLVGIKLWEKKDTYLVRFSSKNISMSGLDVGSAVKYSGIQVGRVQSIKIDPQDVSVILVNLELQEDTPISEDSVASLGNVGITGLKYIELSRGSLHSRLRKPGEEIPAGDSFMDEITGKASVIADKVELLLNRINQFMSEERQQEFWATISSVKQLVQTADGTVEETAPELVSLSRKMSELASQLNNLTANVDALIKTNTPQIQKMFENASVLLESIHESRKKLDTLLEQSSGILTSLDKNLGESGIQETVSRMNTFLERSTILLMQGQDDILITLEHLREASENLDDFSVTIRESPSSLLRSKDAEEREFK